MKKVLILFSFIFASLFGCAFASDALPNTSGNTPAVSNPEQPVKPVANIVKNDDIVVTEAISGLYVVKINTAILQGQIKTHYVVHLTTNKEVYDTTKSRLVVNAGFFDPQNEQTVSYLTCNGNQVLDPHRNINLMENAALKPYMDLILNRSEFRVLEKEGKFKYDIAPHNEEIPAGYKLKHAVQAGPMLLPDFRLEEEFFILKKDGKVVSESASSLKKYARTAIGIKNNNVYLIIATNKFPMTLEEVAKFGKVLELEKMMAFDGGGSTSLDFEDFHIVSDKDETARKLKSFLLITK